MARGWESKSVEDQIAERESNSRTDNQKKASQAEIAQRAKLESIRLARTHTLAALESARDERYRAQLERALSHLDSEIAKLGAS